MSKHGHGANAMQARERTVSWGDPESCLPWLQNKSGLEFVQALADGTLPNPPMFELVGLRVVDAREGEVTAECETGEHLYNAASAVHGGVMATLIDTTTVLAVRSCLPHGSRMTSVELKLNFLRSLSKDSGKIVAVGTVIHRGRRICVAEGKVYTQDRKLAAVGSASLALL